MIPPSRSPPLPFLHSSRRRDASPLNSKRVRGETVGLWTQCEIEMASDDSGNAPSWLFSFVDLAFLSLIVMTQMASNVDTAAPDLGDMVVLGRTYNFNAYFGIILFDVLISLEDISK